MKDRYYTLFQKLKREHVPAGLYQRIVSEIALLEKRVVLARRLSFTVVSLGFIATFIPAWNYLALQFSQSSFASYLSLVISNGDFTLISSKEFLLSLVESLPLTAITLAVALIFMLLGAIRLIGTQTRGAVELLSERFA